MKIEAKQRLQAAKSAASKRALNAVKAKLIALLGSDPKLVWEDQPTYMVWDKVAPSTSGQTNKTAQEFMRSSEFARKISAALKLEPVAFSNRARSLMWRSDGWMVSWSGYNRSVELDGKPHPFEDTQNNLTS